MDKVELSAGVGVASADWNGVAKALTAAVGVAKSPAAERVAGATAGQPSIPAIGERMAGS